MRDEKPVVSSLTVLPVNMYKVSRDWIDAIFMEFKCTVMRKAIASDCSRDFLAYLNDLHLLLLSDGRFKVHEGEPGGAPPPVNDYNNDEPRFSPELSTLPPEILDELTSESVSEPMALNDQSETSEASSSEEDNPAPVDEPPAA